MSGGVVGASVGLIERERELDSDSKSSEGEREVRCAPSTVLLRERLPRRIGIGGGSICEEKGGQAMTTSSVITESRIDDREGERSLEPRTRRAEREHDLDFEEESLDEEESADDMASLGCEWWW